MKIKLSCNFNLNSVFNSFAVAVYLAVLPLLITFTTTCLISCSKRSTVSADDMKDEDVYQNDTAEIDTAQTYDALLRPCEDKGMDYIDSFIFFGESTTYHLKSRGVLSGGTDTMQVWANESGTIMLDLSIDKQKIIYPETGERLTIGEAMARKKPERILLTFGLNGAVQNVRRGESYFKSCYKKLIDAIKSASPNTVIILQSAFPIAENMDMKAYSVDLKTLNDYIDVINEWTYSLACTENCKYLDTNKILKNENNYLKTEYQSGDGHHLTAEAYKDILYYIRTHGE